jgi:hypothetical protein
MHSQALRGGSELERSSPTLASALRSIADAAFAFALRSPPMKNCQKPIIFGEKQIAAAAHHLAGQARPAHVCVRFMKHRRRRDVIASIKTFAAFACTDNPCLRTALAFPSPVIAAQSTSDLGSRGTQRKSRRTQRRHCKRDSNLGQLSH